MTLKKEKLADMTAHEFSISIASYTEGQHTAYKLAHAITLIYAEYATDDKVRDAMERLAAEIYECDALNRRMLGLDEQEQEHEQEATQ